MAQFYGMNTSQHSIFFIFIKKQLNATKIKEGKNNNVQQNRILNERNECARDTSHANSNSVHIRFDSDISSWCSFFLLWSCLFALLALFHRDSDEDDYNDAYAKHSYSFYDVSDGTRMNNSKELAVNHRNKENGNATILFDNSFGSKKVSTKFSANNKQRKECIFIYTCICCFSFFALCGCCLSRNDSYVWYIFLPGHHTVV